jgi:hypothetical protein
LIPGRPRGRAFDLLLTSDVALIRGDAELVLPWSSHLDFTDDGFSTQGWCVSGWGGKGDVGAALKLLGDLDQQSQSLPWMSSWSARWNREPNGGGRVPLHRKEVALLVHESDRDVLHALCTALARRADLRNRLADEQVVTALVERVVTTPHVRSYALHGARQSTIATASALTSLGFTHPVGGRPLPDQNLPTAEELLPAVLEAITTNPYAQSVEVNPVAVLSIIDRTYSGVPPWPFEPLFDDDASHRPADCVHVDSSTRGCVSPLDRESGRRKAQPG